MAFVAKDKNGSEFIYGKRPCKGIDEWNANPFDVGISIPYGSIKKLIGRELSFDDEPVELT